MNDECSFRANTRFYGDILSQSMIFSKLLHEIESVSTIVIG